MSKSNYLCILYILFVSAFSMIPLGYISNDGFLVLTLLYLYGGVKYYGKYKEIYFQKKYYSLIEWIFVGFLGSMLMAFMFYGQGFIQSVITYREQLLMLTPFFLAQIAPSEEDVMDSLRKFSIIYGPVVVLNYLYPSIMVSNVNAEVIDFKSIDEAMVPGYSMLTIYLYYLLQQLRSHFDMKKLLFIIYILAVLVMIQNRSTLFPALLISAYMLLKMNTKFKPIIMLVVISIAAVFVVDIIESLIEQTGSELENKDANRNKAFLYFLFEYSPSWLCYIFGNGILSLHVSSKIQDLQMMGIHNSDLGFIGYWTQLGIIPIIVFMYIYLGSLKRNMPIYIKLISIQTLICGLTISFFARAPHMIFFIMFYYLYSLYTMAEPLYDEDDEDDSEDEPDDDRSMTSYYS